MFLPNPPLAILELPNCLGHEWLTFLKRCYWLFRQKYNEHVRMYVCKNLFKDASLVNK